MSSKSWTFWIDTGGTFTDCLSFRPDGALQRLKVLSSATLRGKIKRKLHPNTFEIHHSWPINRDIFRDYQFKLPGKTISNLLVRSVDFENNTIELSEDIDEEELQDREFEICSGEEAPVLCIRLATCTSLTEVLPPMEIRLGSTKGTNALLERKGARVSLIITAGFADLVEIGTQQRPEIFSLDVRKPRPLYTNVVEVPERIDAEGHAVQAPDDKSIESLCNKLQDSEAVAIALINSYKNKAHENVIDAALHKAGVAHVSVASDMAAEIKILQRANTAIVNAYLSPVIRDYTRAVLSKVPGGSLKIMTSAGGLVDAELFQPKDSLLSGPAGGVVGAAYVAGIMEEDKILAFDMGGTSTDVSRYDGHFDYCFETEIDGIPIFTPSMNIETVAAGGGSICRSDGYRLLVGPESAGASPGPACYGAGGPLAITDVNLLLGRVDPENFGIPVNRYTAERALEQLLSEMKEEVRGEQVLEGLLRIANEKMAEAIKKISISKGYDASEYTLLAFGGAGGQHACAIASLLKIRKIIVPFDAGLLSALGMGVAEIERFASRQLLQPLSTYRDQLPALFNALAKEAKDQLLKEGIPRSAIYTRRRVVNMRFKGQESTLEIFFDNPDALKCQFRNAYENLYGHWVEGDIEIESIRLVAAARQDHALPTFKDSKKYKPDAFKYVHSYTAAGWKDIPAYEWVELAPGADIDGPALIMSATSTVFVDEGWHLVLGTDLNAVISSHSNLQLESTTRAKSASTAASIELFSNRFKSVADEMGAVLQRTSFSVNVKERLDFSCAAMDANGFLVANAPHIPVHLGGLGICVRSVIEHITLHPGDVVITNHPAYGGSHLPDITLVSPVFDDHLKLVGYVANRAHHAELGGIAPGSVPANARHLAEEGVVIPPTLLVKGGKTDWEKIRHLLSHSIYPSRAVDENLADLNGALASIRTGVKALQTLCRSYGTDIVQSYMEALQQYSDQALRDIFGQMADNEWQAVEYLDDGHRIEVKIRKDRNHIHFDFSGSSGLHPGNLNATFAILNSAIIYVLKLMITAPIPLNEGIMRQVQISVPPGYLNPVFHEDPTKCPAVVGGNTETSQRIVDTLIKALRLAACSQGTMNNLIFGNAQFGFYETIGGGVGAGDGFHGASGVHQHMTNTKITDPEIMEFRYPVRVHRMAIRKGSGGKGRWNGGDGIVREITFNDAVDLNILSQHRREAPFGLSGGQPGKTGRQWVIRRDGTKLVLNGIDGLKLDKGDRVIMETPGGGGWGAEV